MREFKSIDGNTTFFRYDPTVESTCKNSFVKKLQQYLKAHGVIRSANFTEAEAANAWSLNLSTVDFTRVSFYDCIFKDLFLADINFHRAQLIGCDFTGAHLNGVNFSGANLSGSIGLLDSGEWLKKNFTFTKNGITVYKAFGDPIHTAPKHWVIKCGSVITETVNPDRATECGCGINFGTRDYVFNEHYFNPIWQCLIEWPDVANVIVPYMTDGKARCSRLKLIRKVHG